jgi:mannose-6-phosphate isomerase-like protein (cupin superfamily)
MPEARPTPVGSYRLLQDYTDRRLSIRVIAMSESAAQVQPHVHARSAQVYMVLEGRAEIECDGVITLAEPYAVVPVPIGSVHSARPYGGPAVVMNLSIPPLAADDQAPMVSAHEPPDMRLPRVGEDADD